MTATTEGLAKVARLRDAYAIVLHELGYSKQAFRLPEPLGEFSIRNAPCISELPRNEQDKVHQLVRDRQNNPPRNETVANVIRRLDDYAANAESLWNIQPFFYDRAGLFWIWDFNTNAYQIKDEIDVIDALERELAFDGKSLFRKSVYLDALRLVGRRHIPKDLPKSCVQFKDKIVNAKTGEVFDASPSWFAVNPIPWKLTNDGQTPKLDALFTQWVTQKNVVMLKEVMAFSMAQEYFIHRFFVLLGSGRNGKGTFLRILQSYLGVRNCTSSDLDLLLTNRFETAKLYRKLVCLLGETDYSRLRNTSTLKRITGEDLTSFEFKGKTPIDDTNYATIIIASNGIPVTADKSDGFYRRPLIIEFPNNFNESDVLNEIPQAEYAALTGQLLEILKRLYTERKFTNEGTVEDRAREYEKHSNPLPEFLKERCHIGFDKAVRFGQLHAAFVEFCKERKFRLVSKKEFSRWLSDESIESRKARVNGSDVDTFVYGYDLKLSVTNVTNVTHPSSEFKIKEASENKSTSVTSVTNLTTFLRAHPGSSFEELFSAFPNDPVELWLIQLQKKGDVIEPRPGHWQVLE